MITRLVFLSAIATVLAQYAQQDDGQYRQQQYKEEPYSQPTRPPPRILSHKQAQNHDGAFKYAFAAENGLQQGEIIAPDGSRNGGYTYVDPHGKTISVKYTAGKEGFRILEGDHLPKAPQAHVPVPAAPQHQQQPAYNHYQQRSDEDDGQYRPEKYEQPQRPPYYPKQPIITFNNAPKPLNTVPFQQAAPPQYQRPAPQYQPQPNYEQRSNQIEDKEPEYHDEPGKPHTFGNGYFFEFAG